VELVVVVAILALVIVTTVSLFVSMIRSQKRILAEQELLNQSSYVIEYIGRAIRMAGEDIDGACLGTENIGKSYLLTDKNEDNPLGNEYSGIKFINSSNKNICQKFVLDLSYRIKESKDGGSTFGFLTADFLQVNFFHFKLYEDSSTQPRVTVFMDIQIKGTEGDEPRENIQTTISQRNIGGLTYGFPEAPCGGYLSNGHCWYAGADNQSCNDLCAEKGLIPESDCCEIDTNCEATNYLIGIASSCSDFCPAGQRSYEGVGIENLSCFNQDYCNCSAGEVGYKRICACKN